MGSMWTSSVVFPTLLSTLKNWCKIWHPWGCPYIIWSGFYLFSITSRLVESYDSPVLQNTNKERERKQRRSNHIKGIILWDESMPPLMIFVEKIILHFHSSLFDMAKIKWKLLGLAREKKTDYATLGSKWENDLQTVSHWSLYTDWLFGSVAQSTYINHLEICYKLLKLIWNFDFQNQNLRTI